MFAVLLLTPEVLKNKLFIQKLCEKEGGSLSHEINPTIAQVYHNSEKKARYVTNLSTSFTSQENSTFPGI